MELTLDKVEAIVDDLFAAGTRRIGRLTRSKAREARELIPGSLFSIGMRSNDYGQVDVQLFAGLGDLGGVLWKQELRTLRSISTLNEPGLPRILEGDSDPILDIAFVVSDGSDQTLSDEGVLEYLAAESNRRLAFTQFKTLLAALRRLHARRLMHRSVAPASIDVVFEDPGSAETIGLRLARFEMSALIENVLRYGDNGNVAQLRQSGAAWQTDSRALHFMPPERLAALQPALGWDALQDIRSDVFGLGVLAYCLFVRRGWLIAEEAVVPEMLFSPEAIRDAFDSRRRYLESAEVRRRVPVELLSIIGEMMHFERGKRPTAWQAEDDLRKASAAIESSWLSGEEWTEAAPRVVSVAPEYFKATFYDGRPENKVLSHPPDTEIGKKELREYVEKDLRQAHVYYEPDGYALVSGDFRDDRHTAAKFVLVGQSWLYFGAPFRKNPLLKSSAVDEVLHLAFVLARTNRLAKRLLTQATLTMVGPVQVVFAKDAAHAATGKPEWSPLLQKVSLGNRVSQSKLRVKYQAALDFVIELAAAQIASRQYACRVRPFEDTSFVLLEPDQDADGDRRRKWALLWALDRAQRFPEFADFFDGLEVSERSGVELRLWPRSADDRTSRGDRASSMVVALDRRIGRGLLVSLPPGNKVDDLPPLVWASPLDDDGTAVVQARQRQGVDEILERPELLAQIDHPSVVVTEQMGHERFKEGLRGQAPALLDTLLHSWPIFAVHGPPGTGKTLLAARAVASAFDADRSLRILVSAQSHDALDNMAERIISTLSAFSLLDRLTCVRVATPGSENRISESMMRYVASAQTDTLLQGIQDRVVQHKIDNNLPPELLRIATRWAAESQRTPRELEDRLRRGANLVFVTCGSATPQKLAVAGDDGLFDWAIIEEAARAWLPELALPLVRAARWALIGDYRQLPPFGAQELQRVLDVCEAEKNDDDDLKAFVAHKDAIYSATSTFKSLFVDMSNEPRPVSGDKPPRGGLKTQFRMDSSIGELINQSFYGGKLLCGTTERTPFLLYRPSWLEHKSLVWLDTSELPCEEHPRWSNPVEGKIAAALARALRVEGNAPADCALLSPYRAQVKRLEKYMGTDHSVAVKTVDSFQGKEADVVIISLVRQNSGQDALKRIGHLDNEARVNVMCSRAKRLLVLVGNYPHFDRTDSEVWNKLFTHFRALGKRLDAKKYFTPEGRALQW